MKTFRFFAALMLAVVCVGLSSCNKDDEDEKFDNSLLVGTWVADDGATEITFKADGTGFEIDEKETDKFTYTFDAKTMILALNYEKPDTTGESQFSAKVEINGDKLKVGDSVYTRKKK